MLRITQNLFFGRTNPSWIVSRSYTPFVLQYIAHHREGIDTRFFPAKAGFTSRTVEILDVALAKSYDLPVCFVVYDGNAPNNATSGEILETLTDIINAPDIEDRITPSLVLDGNQAADLTTYYTGDWKRWDVNDQTGKANAYPEREPFHPDYTHGSTIQLPRFHTTEWNYEHILGNNCYAYACNVVIHNPGQTKWPQPGLCHKERAPTDDQALLEGLKSDGIERLEYGMSPVIGTDDQPAWIVALSSGHPYTSQEGEWDYHFFRKVWSGYKIYFWAHKPGATRVTNLVRNRKRVIIDPEEEARNLGYENFLGYFAIHAAKICAPT